MLTHEQIWGAIDALAARHQFSPSGLAKKAGLDPTTFNKSKRITTNGKPRWPSTESLAKILEVTGSSFDDFVELMHTASEPTYFEDRLVPMMGFAEAAQDDHFDSMSTQAGKDWQCLELPQLGSDHCFAVEISSRKMEPVYRAGDILLVSRSAKIRSRDRVAIKTVTGELIAKVFHRETANGVEFKPLGLNDEAQFLRRQEFDWMARILWVKQ